MGSMTTDLKHCSIGIILTHHVQVFSLTLDSRAKSVDIYLYFIMIKISPGLCGLTNIM